MKSNTLASFQLNPEGDRLDYSHIIREAGGLPEDSAVFNIWQPLPTDLLGINRLILTGSVLTISEPRENILRERSEIISYMALDFADKGTQVLAICYGAQIVANELWPGSVVRTDRWNVGRTKIIPLQNHPTLGRMGVPMSISVSYKDMIRDIPEENVLAVDFNGNIIAYQFKNFIGILGHPEIPIPIIKTLIESRREDPRYKNANILELSQEEENNLEPSINIVKRFLNTSNEQ